MMDLHCFYTVLHWCHTGFDWVYAKKRMLDCCRGARGALHHPAGRFRGADR